MSVTKPGFVEKRLKLQRKHIEQLADYAYERCDGCTEFEEKMWKEGFIVGYHAAELELNQNNIPGIKIAIKNCYSELKSAKQD